MKANRSQQLCIKIDESQYCAGCFCVGLILCLPVKVPRLLYDNAEVWGCSEFYMHMRTILSTPIAMIVLAATLLKDNTVACHSIGVPSARVRSCDDCQTAACQH